MYIKTHVAELKSQQAELEWAHIFHDTIKDRPWLNNLSISPGRWAANYSFLYILARILSDYKPAKILEFGLGESSKVISTFLENELHDSSHLIVEHDTNWIDTFGKKFCLSPRSLILHLPLALKKIKGFDVEIFDGLKDKISESYTLYIVDAPFGSQRYSRYDICALAEELTLKDDFMIILDDCERLGEQDTIRDLIALLEGKGLKIFTKIYKGTKSQIVITTDKYRYATSL